VPVFRALRTRETRVRRRSECVSRRQDRQIIHGRRCARADGPFKGCFVAGDASARRARGKNPKKQKNRLRYEPTSFTKSFT
jgi:hypothetical protein